MCVFSAAAPPDSSARNARSQQPLGGNFNTNRASAMNRTMSREWRIEPKIPMDVVLSERVYVL